MDLQIKYSSTFSKFVSDCFFLINISLELFRKHTLKWWRIIYAVTPPGQAHMFVIHPYQSCKSMFLPEAVIEILKEYKVEQDRYKVILGDKWVATGKVFTAVNGDLINPNDISLWFKRFLKKYELPCITLHELRHTSISFILMQNVLLEVVAERAGHRDTSVTSGIYGHVFKESKKKAVKTIEKMFTVRGVV